MAIHLHLCYCKPRGFPSLSQGSTPAPCLLYPSPTTQGCHLGSRHTRAWRSEGVRTGLKLGRSEAGYTAAQPLLPSMRRGAGLQRQPMLIHPQQGVGGETFLPRAQRTPRAGDAPLCTRQCRPASLMCMLFHTPQYGFGGLSKVIAVAEVQRTLFRVSSRKASES